MSQCGFPKTILVNLATCMARPIFAHVTPQRRVLHNKTPWCFIHLDVVFPLKLMHHTAWLEPRKNQKQAVEDESEG